MEPLSYSLFSRMRTTTAGMKKPTRCQAGLSSSMCSRDVLHLLPVLEPVTLAVHVQDAGALNQPSDKRFRHDGIPDDLRPFGEFMVTRDDRAAKFVPAGQQLKQKL